LRAISPHLKNIHGGNPISSKESSVLGLTLKKQSLPNPSPLAEWPPLAGRMALWARFIESVTPHSYEVLNEQALLELKTMDIYVGNLPYTATEGDVSALFAAYGPVERVKIITDRETGQSKGFAFVTLGDQTQLDAAIEALNNFDYSGRPLRVNASEPKEARPGGGGGYGGGGGGGYKGGGGGGGGGYGGGGSSSKGGGGW
jgi:uncharacterized membrane protein YgcG